jgi:hypothetical protein
MSALSLVFSHSCFRSACILISYFQYIVLDHLDGVLVQLLPGDSFALAAETRAEGLALTSLCHLTEQTKCKTTGKKALYLKVEIKLIPFKPT